MPRRKGTFLPGGRDHHPKPRPPVMPGPELESMRPDNPYLYDGFTTGWHAGKGPKGYRRPDSSIHDDIADALTRSSEIDATDIEIKVRQGEVTLSGEVMTRRMKRLAEDIALNLPGVKDVHNRISIRDREL